MLLETESCESARTRDCKMLVRAPFSRSSDSRAAYSIIPLIKIESYELFQFPNCSRVVKSSFADVYICVVSFGQSFKIETGTNVLKMSQSIANDVSFREN